MAQINNVEGMLIELMGKPKMRTKSHYRYGQRGSLSVRLDDGVFYSFEDGESGDGVALVQRELHTDFRGAKQWLVDGGYWVEDTDYVRRYLKPEQRSTYEHYCMVFESWDRQGKKMTDLDRKKYEYQKSELQKDAR